MGDVDTSVKHGGFTEDDELLAEGVAFLDVLAILEPDEVDDACAVGEVSDGALLASRAHGLVTENLASQLNIGHIAVYLVDVIETATVDVLIGKIVEKIAEGGDAQLLTQQLGTLRADAGEKLDVGMGKGAHRVSATARS